MVMKCYYNWKHTAKYFNVSDWVMLRLHQGYKVLLPLPDK